MSRNGVVEEYRSFSVPAWRGKGLDGRAAIGKALPRWAEATGS